MITEKQRNLIFDINCFYQLESQKEKIALGHPIAMLPELSFVAMKTNSNEQPINWIEKQRELNEKLKNYGLSEKWILTLSTCLNRHLAMGTSIEEFRLKFLTPIDLLVNMIIGIIINADRSFPKEQIAEGVIGDILEKNYWEEPVVHQVNTVRTLSTNLGFDKSFVIEFGKVFVRQN